MTQQILFCADKYAENVEFVEQVIKESFPEPRYQVISLRIHPDQVTQQVAQWAHDQKIFSNPPALFFYWKCLNERADIASIWHPLFEKCKAVALVHLLEQPTDEGKIESYWKNGWKFGNIPHNIININRQQISLNDAQRSALQEICNVKVIQHADKKHIYVLALVVLGSLALIGFLYRRQFPHSKYPRKSAL
jgi:cell division protein YceG involved in septum cleavage